MIERMVCTTQIKTGLGAYVSPTKNKTPEKKQKIFFFPQVDVFEVEVACTELNENIRNKQRCVVLDRIFGHIFCLAQYCVGIKKNETTKY